MAGKAMLPMGMENFQHIRKEGFYYVDKTGMIKDTQHSESFGFSDSEVRELLAYYDFMDKYDAIKKWYDGYRLNGACHPEQGDPLHLYGTDPGLVQG